MASLLDKGNEPTQPLEVVKICFRLLPWVLCPPVLVVIVAIMIDGYAKMYGSGNDWVWLAGMGFVAGVALGAAPLTDLHVLLRGGLTQNTGVGVPLPYEGSRRCIYLGKLTHIRRRPTLLSPSHVNNACPVNVLEGLQRHLANIPRGSCFGNPSSAHALGRKCKAAVDKARERMAVLLGCTPEEVVIVGSGSEADNHAILAAVELHAKSVPSTEGGPSRPKPHVVSSAVEHPAITKCLDYLVSEGRVEVTYVGVDEEGRVSVENVLAAFRPETALVTIMHSNNEVGSLQPIKRIAAACRQQGILCHTDAAQSVGKVAVKVQDLGVDMLTLVGHKFGAPKGVAALFVRRGLVLPPLIHGGGQEAGRRAGTENVLLISGMGKAAEIVHRELEQLSNHLAKMRERLLGHLLTAKLGTGVRVHGPKDASLRLPNTLSVGVPGLKARILLERLSETVAASAGSACHAGGATVSAVLQAMGVDKSTGLGTLRLSVGRHTTEWEVDQAAAAIIREAKNMIADM